MGYFSLLHSQFHESFGTHVQCFCISFHSIIRPFVQQKRWDKPPCTNKLRFLYAYSRGIVSFHPLSTPMGTVTVFLRNLALEFRKSESCKTSLWSNWHLCWENREKLSNEKVSSHLLHCILWWVYLVPESHKSLTRSVFFETRFVRTIHQRWPEYYTQVFE